MKSDKVCQTFIQLCVENHRRWRLHNVSGQHPARLDCPHSKKVLLSSLKLSFQFMAVCPHYISLHFC